MKSHTGFSILLCKIVPSEELKIGEKDVISMQGHIFMPRWANKMKARSFTYGWLIETWLINRLF